MIYQCRDAAIDEKHRNTRNTVENYKRKRQHNTALQLSFEKAPHSRRISRLWGASLSKQL